MVFCETCGTENRDKARFCCGCARALAPVSSASGVVVSAPGPVQTCPACQTVNPLAATVCKSCRASLVPDLAKPALAVSPPASRGLVFKTAGVLCLGAVVAAVWWSGAKEGADSRSAVASAPSDSRTTSPAAPPVPAGASIALNAVSAPPLPGENSVAAPTGRSAQEKVVGDDARVKRQAASQARREQAARERTATEERARAARALEQQRADEAARQKATAEAAQLARAAKAISPPSASVVKTVEQTCASSGNFFSREVCRLRSCGDAAFSSDPVCVRFREMEAANRRAVTN